MTDIDELLIQQRDKHFNEREPGQPDYCGECADDGETIEPWPCKPWRDWNTLIKAKREGTLCAHEFVPDGWVVTDSWTSNGVHFAVPNAWQTTHYRCKFCLLRESVS